MISAAQSAYFQAIQTIKTQSVPVDLAARGVGQSEQASPAGRFSSIMSSFLTQTSEAQSKSKEFNYRLQMGDPSMSIEKATIQSNVASLQFSAVMSTRNKLLEAYREIINTPV